MISWKSGHAVKYWFLYYFQITRRTFSFSKIAPRNLPKALHIFTFREFPHTEGSTISNYEFETGIGYNNRCEFYNLLSIMNATYESAGVGSRPRIVQIGFWKAFRYVHCANHAYHQKMQLNRVSNWIKREALLQQLVHKTICFFGS